jgi:hypothetical protein
MPPWQCTVAAPWWQQLPRPCLPASRCQHASCRLRCRRRRRPCRRRCHCHHRQAAAKLPPSCRQAAAAAAATAAAALLLRFPPWCCCQGCRAAAALLPSFQASKLAAAAALPPPPSSWRYCWRHAIIAALLPHCLPPLPLCCRAAAWSACEHLGELGRAWEASERLGEQVSLLVGELVGGEFVPWPAHTAFNRNRNPEESSGFRSNPE